MNALSHTQSEASVDGLFQARQHPYRLIQGLGQEKDTIKRLTLTLAERYGKVIETYGKVYEVYDRKPVCPDQVPVSQTHQAIHFHTDSSQKDTCPDIVGLACVHRAFGGDTVLADAELAYQHLQRFHPWTLPILKRPFHRALVTPNTEKSPDAVLRNRFPIYTRESDGTHAIRYMRRWIEDGAKIAQVRLDELTLTALDHLDHALASSVIYQRQLKRGELLFFNNRRIVHARLPYREIGQQHRLLFRVWLDAGYMKRSARERSSVLAPS